MAHGPLSKLNPSEPREPNLARESGSADHDESADSPSLTKYLSTLAECGAGSVSAEVALDLVLNEVVERACLATSATAGAIALAHNGEMVCRATIGENAPELGVRLDTTHGLSGACVRTKQWQRCNDAENDSRVDAAVCRRLGVRSILVVPVQRAEELIGVIEVFSVRADAFSNHDVERLQAFSLEVVKNVERAIGAQAPQPQPGPVEPPSSAASSDSAILGLKTFASEVTLGMKESTPRKDLSTTALLVCVILLALIVGWMAGRGEWRRTKTKPAVSAGQVAKGQAEPSPANSPPTTSVEQPPREQSHAAELNFKPMGADSAVDNTLIVTRNGKVVFRSPPPHVKDSGGTDQPTGGKGASKSPRLWISPEIAEEHLLTRVEPEYPEEARKNGVQGPVVLDAWVGKDGAVQKLTVVSGNPELVQAATQAVQRWHFRSFFQQGQPQEFTTRITVVFRLP